MAAAIVHWVSCDRHDCSHVKWSLLAPKGTNSETKIVNLRATLSLDAAVRLANSLHAAFELTIGFTLASATLAVTIDGKGSSKPDYELTQDKSEFWFEVCNFAVRFSAHVAWASVLSLNNLKLNKTKRVKNICI